VNSGAHTQVAHTQTRGHTSYTCARRHPYSNTRHKQHTLAVHSARQPFSVRQRKEEMKGRNSISSISLSLALLSLSLSHTHTHTQAHKGTRHEAPRCFTQARKRVGGWSLNRDVVYSSQSRKRKRTHATIHKILPPVLVIQKLTIVYSLLLAFLFFVFCVVCMFFPSF
jgi:hypothetical protein